jgi:anti-sigma-K factor RskA/putative zinc finger protein
LLVEDGMMTHEQFAEDLALYALNELAGSERLEFEEHLEACASCRRELLYLRSDMGLLALTASGPRPPARSKDRLMHAVAADPRGVSAPAPERVVRRGFGWAWVPALAALALLFAVGNLWRENGQMHDELARLTGLYQNTSSQLAQTSNQLSQDEERLRLLSAPDAVQVSLSAQSEARKPHATAIYSPSQKRLMLVASNLAPVPPGKAYELWLIPMEGAPVPAGVFWPDSHGNAKMMDHVVPQGVVAKAFAVTVENEAGSDKPTSPILIGGQGL